MTLCVVVAGFNPPRFRPPGAAGPLSYADAKDQAMARKQPNSLRARRTRRSLLIAAGALSAGAVAAAALAVRPSRADEDMVVYKSPSCRCCGAWVKHMQKAGLRVRVINESDIGPIREKLGTPADLASCHIAAIDGYIVEGHVPADAIEKLLAERPDAVGLFLPGMPLGSPGMESPGGGEPYDVIMLRRDGSRETFARYGA